MKKCLALKLHVYADGHYFMEWNEILIKHRTVICKSSLQYYNDLHKLYINR